MSVKLLCCCGLLRALKATLERSNIFSIRGLVKRWLAGSTFSDFVGPSLLWLRNTLSILFDTHWVAPGEELGWILVCILGPLGTLFASVVSTF